MRMACSFTTTEFSRVKRHWQKSSRYVDGRLAGTGASANGLSPNGRGFEPFVGGALAIMELSSGRIELSMQMDSPGGILVEGEVLYANNMRLHHIGVFDLARAKELGRIENRAFNNLHSLERTAGGLLVSSSGTDAVFEVDEGGRTLFEWWATEHGLDRLTDGSRRDLRRDGDHSQRFYPTLFQSTHVNSATLDEHGRVLATLFHQGSLLRIERTGSAQVLVRALDCPHGARRMSDGGWTVSNTRQNQVLVLDEEFRVRRTIDLGFSWVQDTVPLADNTLLVADANHCRIVRMDWENETVLEEVRFDPEWRIYQVLPLE